MTKYHKPYLKSILFSLGMSALIYLIAVFYKWDFYNPIRYVLGMPSWSGGHRILFVVSVISYLIGNQFLFKSFTSTNEDEKENGSFGAVAAYVVSIFCAVMICTFL